MDSIISETDGKLADDAVNDLLVWFFLAPGGIVTEKEILVYDGYDLIGNIGGFLGLFLGASILSMYDHLRERIVSMKYFNN